jgi:hypothetical protein
MFRQYKEIFYGVLLGLGVWAIDVGMHAHSAGRSFWAELVWSQDVALVYRLLFVVFGLILGWSLWKNNARERGFRQLAETLARFHLEIVQPAFLIHADAEVLLSREDMHLAPVAVEVVRSIYEKSQFIVSLAKERLPAEIRS